MTSTSRITIRRFAVAATIVAAVLTASGCSGAGIDAGAAAVVGDRRISVADVQTATQEFNMFPGLQQQVSQREILSYLVVGPLYEQTAASRGAGVSDDDAAKYLVDNKWVNSLTGSKQPSPATVAFVRSGLSRSNLLPRQDGSGPPVDEAIKTLQDISTQLKSTDIRINPRYGTLTKTFDPQGQGIFDIVPSTPKWLVSQSPTATAPAPATPEAP